MNQNIENAYTFLDELKKENEAGLTDDMNKSVSYADVYEVVKEITEKTAAKGSFQ